MYKFLFFLFFPILSFAQSTFNLDTVKVCQSYQQIQLSSIPENLGNVDFSITNFDTVFNVVDDIHSGIINLGFNFSFFGNQYSQAVISTNGYLSFETVHANTNSQWSIDSDIPNNANTDAQNSIMCPYTDSEPGPNSNMIYGVAGIAPNRAFVVIWNDFEMYGFNCNNLCYSSSVMIFEGTNKIINSIYNYESCPPNANNNGWNDGAGVQGLYKDATTAIIIDDPVTNLPRNYSDVWNTNVESWVYTPVGNTYNYQKLPVFSNLVRPDWVSALNGYLGTGYIHNYTAPNLADLPTTITLKSRQCDDSVFVNIPVVVDCPPVYISSGGESCYDDKDGKVFVDIEKFCNVESVLWDINLLNSNNQVIDTKQDSLFPLSFDNLTSGVYYVEYSSPIVNCSDTIEIVVPQLYHKALYHAEIENALCYGENSGSIDFNVFGGQNKDWKVTIKDKNTGQTIATQTGNANHYLFENLPNGDYIFISESPTTCITEAEYSVNQPSRLEFSKDEIKHNLCSETNSLIDFEAQGGVPPYTYYLDSVKSIDLYKENLKSGTHYIQIFDKNNCEIYREIEVLDLHNPIVKYEFDKSEHNLKDATITFTNKSLTNKHTELDSYYWEFGDGVFSLEENPTHTYKDIGNYIVELYVTDKNGCTFNLRDTVKIVSPNMMFPTVFTPNFDGKNEFFKPIHDKIETKDYSLIIYNRWGELMFETKDIKKGWSGFDKNGEIQTGTYIYYCTYKDIYGYDHNISGNIHLLR